MKCDNCGKELTKFCYAIPTGVYGNRKPWMLCTKKCIEAKVKKVLKERKLREDKKDGKKGK